MSFSKVYSVQNNLLKAQIIDVECDITTGMYSFGIVGLGDKAIEEAKDRISSAIKNCGLESPKKGNNKTIISLAPANAKKTGPIFDLAIALSFLKASKQISFSNKDRIFIGELSLDGNIREVKGILPMVVESKARGFKEIFIPIKNAKEAALVEGVAIFPCENLNQVVKFLNVNTQDIVEISPQPQTEIIKNDLSDEDILLEHIKGNENAKQALIIALAGGHNICFYGPPGTGKTMLAKVSKTLLPKLSIEDVLEVTSLYSISGELKDEIITVPPFRSPHHTSSHVAVVGGGTDIKPGEISLAHKGILFLDEFPEFDRRVVDSLRQPLEEKEVKISRAKESAILPADFVLIISMNPCPCGFFGYNSKNCSCSMSQIMKYQKKISGPIMDRIDIWIEVSSVEYKRLIEQNEKQLVLMQDCDKTKKAQYLILQTRKKQQENNFKILKKNILNGNLKTNELEKILIMEEGVKNFFDESAEKLSLSARSYVKILKIALTISQLRSEPKIKKEHILEALSWRPNSKFFI
jgi:magnesium chelatase family protein